MNSKNRVRLERLVAARSASLLLVNAYDGRHLPGGSDALAVAADKWRKAMWNGVMASRHASGAALRKAAGAILRDMIAQPASVTDSDRDASIRALLEAARATLRTEFSYSVVECVAPVGRWAWELIARLDGGLHVHKAWERGTEASRADAQCAAFNAMVRSAAATSV